MSNGAEMLERPLADGRIELFGFSSCSNRSHSHAVFRLIRVRHPLVVSLRRCHHTSHPSSVDSCSLDSPRSEPLLKHMAASGRSFQRCMLPSLAPSLVFKGENPPNVPLWRLSRTGAGLPRVVCLPTTTAKSSCTSFDTVERHQDEGIDQAV